MARWDLCCSRTVGSVATAGGLGVSEQAVTAERRCVVTILGETTIGRTSSGTPAPDGRRCLLVRVAGGDVAAFEELFASHHGVVLAVVVSVLRDRAQAQEVTQEVFLQVWQQAGRFDPKLCSSVTWLKRLARRRAIDRVRVCESAGARDTRYAVADVVVDADTVIEQVLHLESHAQLRAALRRLRPLPRESLVLAYYAGMSTAEISDQLGVNRSTIKTRIRDGLRTLRAELHEHPTAGAAYPTLCRRMLLG